MKTNKITVNTETINHLEAILECSIKRMERQLETYYWLTHEDVDELKKIQKFLTESYVGILKKSVEIKIKGSDN